MTEQRIPGPTVRSRINFSRLVKTGWQFEATVELTFEAIDSNTEYHVRNVSESGVTATQPWCSEMTALIEQTNLIAQTEVDRLNAADAVEAKAA